MYLEGFIGNILKFIVLILPAFDVITNATMLIINISDNLVWHFGIKSRAIKIIIETFTCFIPYSYAFFFYNFVFFYID